MIVQEQAESNEFTNPESGGTNANLRHQRLARTDFRCRQVVTIRSMQSSLNARNHSVGMSCQRRCSRLPPNAQIEMLQGFEGTSVSSSQLTNMLCSPHNHRLAASLAYLVRADPFPLDRPCAKTLVVRVIPGEVAMLDESPTRVTTVEVDDLELAVCQYESW